MKLNMSITRFGSALALFGLAVASLIATTLAQQAPTAAQGQAAGTGVNLTAASANVSQPGSPVRINMIRWSTDAERTQIVAAMNPPPPPPAAAPARGAGGDRGGAPPAARGGAAARGGRGGDAAPPPPFDPIASLATAISRAPAIGYLWTEEVAGYSIKYAYRISQPDGGERIILATDRRLGGFAAGWKPVAPTVTDYRFTIIEIRLNARGQGEGKTSLTNKVVVDSAAGTLAVENYAAAPAILANLKR